MKVLEVFIDRRLTFDKHVSAVARSCNYHIQAIRHIRHLLTTELVQMLACSLVLSRLDYCNSLLHSTPTGNIDKLQRVQNRGGFVVVLQAPRRSHTKPLLHQLHWLPVKQRISYKLAVLTSAPPWHHHISAHTSKIEADPTLVLCNRAVWTFLQHNLWQASFLLLSSGHLELSPTYWQQQLWNF